MGYLRAEPCALCRWRLRFSLPLYILSWSNLGQLLFESPLLFNVIRLKVFEQPLLPVSQFLELTFIHQLEETDVSTRLNKKTSDAR